MQNMQTQSLGKVDSQNRFWKTSLTHLFVDNFFKSKQDAS